MIRIFKNNYIKFFSKNKKQDTLDSFPFYRKYPSNINPQIVNSHICISHKNKFVYFRIPKAANSTMISTLYKLETGKVINSNNQNKVQRIKDNFYQFPSNLSSYQVDLISEKYFKFTVVRNPYTRVISCYLDKIVRNKGGKKTIVNKILGKPLNSSINFDEFLNFLESGGLNLNAHWCLQTDLITIPLKSLDYIGKMENLQTDISEIIKQIFGEVNFDIVTANSHKTNKSNVENYLSEKNLRRIRKIYESDFENFNYVF